MTTQNYYELKIKIDGTELLYTYDSGVVTWAARPDLINIPLLEFIEDVKIAEDWIKSVELMPEDHPHYGFPDEPFRFRMSKDNGNLEFRIRLGGNLALNMTFDPATGTVSAAARDSFISTWSGFVYVILLIRRDILDLVNRALV